LRESELPGYTIALQKCGICHSADYINYQPPAMNQSQWTAEMKKMQHSYGAPISEQEIELIGAYLAVAYGSAKASDPSVLALSARAAPADAAAGVDVQELLAANACLGCHAIDKKVVGPSFQDVAARYGDRADAQKLLADSIQSGGSGKWGEMAMPPMAALTESQALALAGYILEQ
jgi:cytochrome c551/c552